MSTPALPETKTLPAMPSPSAALQGLTAISIAGADARTFLQGQLCSDLRKLNAERALLTACNSAQGRVQAVLTLIQRDDTIVAIVAASLASRLLARLRSYVLRSKVTLTELADLAVASLTAADAPRVAETLPSAIGGCVSHRSGTLLRWWGADERYLLVTPRAGLSIHADSLEDLRWRRADIAAGIPQVYPETSELFVAQMLNLDLLGGISFDKGCYTGQEIIARTHYRGTIKRRMLRFAASCAVPTAGTRVLHAGAHCGEVVDACLAGAESGASCELLAVVSLDRATEPLTLDGIDNSTLTRLTLPYDVPQAAAA